MMTANFDLSLKGDVALVTGASSGLGERFARVLAASGASVALVARREDKLQSLANEIRADGGEASCFAFDLCDVEAIPGLLDKINEQLGQVNILINNAGVSDGRRAINTTLDLMDKVLDTNLRSPYMLSCEFAKRLIGAELPGRIVNISTIGAYTCTRPGQALYSVAKCGVVRMTEVLAVEWAPHFINVNAIAPGIFRSEMTAKMFDKLGDPSETLPRKRVCDPAQLDSTLLYLVSPSSQVVTGTVIKVDDGQTGR